MHVILLGVLCIVFVGITRALSLLEKELAVPIFASTIFVRNEDGLSFPRAIFLLSS